MKPFLVFMLALLPCFAQEPIAQRTAAPEFSKGAWINARSPQTLASRRGKVTIVHFWIFKCINCKHNLEAYNNWEKQFRGQDVEYPSHQHQQWRAKANLSR